MFQPLQVFEIKFCDPSEVFPSKLLPDTKYIFFLVEYHLQCNQADYLWIQLWSLSINSIFFQLSKFSYLNKVVIDPPYASDILGEPWKTFHLKTFNFS